MKTAVAKQRTSDGVFTKSSLAKDDTTSRGRLSPKGGQGNSLGQPALELACRGRGTKEEDDSDKTLSLTEKIALDLQ